MSDHPHDDDPCPPRDRDRREADAKGANTEASTEGGTAPVVRLLIVKALVFMLFPAVLAALVVFFMI